MTELDKLQTTLKRQVRAAIATLNCYYWMKRSPSLVVLTYHRVLPKDKAKAEAIQPGMYVDVKTFQAHMRIVRELFTVVKLSEWLSHVADDGNVPKRACAITFDDGWRDNYQYAFPILQREQIPATFFVVTDFVGTTMRFWPERLTRVVSRLNALGALSLWKQDEFLWVRDVWPTPQNLYSSHQIDKLIECAKSLPDDVLQERLSRMEEKLGLAEENEPCLLDWGQAREMVKSGVAEIGSHTRRHIRLRDGINTDTLHDEIVGSKEYLRREIGIDATTFCYPNGDMSETARQVVAQHYQGACTTMRGWNSLEEDRYALRRIGMHEDITGDRTNFLARLSGWV